MCTYVQKDLTCFLTEPVADKIRNAFLPGLKLEIFFSFSFFFLLSRFPGKIAALYPAIQIVSQNVSDVFRPDYVGEV